MGTFRRFRPFSAASSGHFGLDTLTLARKGPTVTSCDYSSAAIEKARWRAKKARFDATLIEGDFYNAPDLISEQFDAVFVS
jgi:ubiquinone/menaquinone biosynthesis C-methylase UbiE